MLLRLETAGLDFRMVMSTETRTSDRDWLPEPSSSPTTGTSEFDDSADDSVRRTVNGAGEGKASSKRRRRRRARDGGASEVKDRASNSKRRNSLSKAARDPRDEPPTKKRKKKAKSEGQATRSPSPVIDFDGLSRPS